MLDNRWRSIPLNMGLIGDHFYVPDPTRVVEKGDYVLDVRSNRWGVVEGMAQINAELNNGDIVEIADLVKLVPVGEDDYDR